MPGTSGVEQKVTYCRLCEPLCGLVATVEDGRLVSLAPDPDHPLSQGQVCPKGLAFAEIQLDDDRLLHPLRRRTDGEFEQVGWDEAIAEIGSRLGAIVAESGGNAVGMYFGNPGAFNSELTVWLGALRGALKNPQMYTPGSQDNNARTVANKLVYGAASQTPFPDLWRTDFLLMFGANPLISHGSLIRVPRVNDVLRGITDRDGRVVVVDPRRTETAKAYEHVAVRPDGDVWLLASILQVIFAEGLTNEAAIAEQSTGVNAVRAFVADLTPEATAARSGVEPEVVRALAQDFAAARAAVAYGRIGICLGRFATLTNYLIDVLNIVTGNLDRPGGSLFIRAVVPLEDLAERAGQLTYDAVRSRVGDFPDVMGTLPASVMADEITTPGPGRLRALFTLAGNPGSSVPDPSRLAAALPQLDLHVSLDLYLNETNRHADFVLPATTFLERPDITMVLAAAGQPFVQSTEAVVTPRGEARHEWRVIDDILRAAGMGPFAPGRAGRLIGKLGVTPRRMIELTMRTGPYGDRFGLRRGGLSPTKLRRERHGIVLADHAPTGLRSQAVRHPDHKAKLDPPQILAEFERLLGGSDEDPAYPLRLISLREMRSLNSWMHNSPTLMKGRARVHRSRVNPVDAAAAGVADGEPMRIRSRHGEITTIALITDEVAPGTIAVPHGWGHDGGWRRANAAGGPNVNDLLSAGVDELERISGTAHLSAVPVAIEAVPAHQALDDDLAAVR